MKRPNKSADPFFADLSINDLDRVSVNASRVIDRRTDSRTDWI